MTLPWFYAHWILIGSLSKVLLTELFTSRSPSKCRLTVKDFSWKYLNILKVRVRDRGWQIKRDKYSELRATDRDTGDKYFWLFSSEDISNISEWEVRRRRSWRCSIFFMETNLKLEHLQHLIRRMARAMIRMLSWTLFNTEEQVFKYIIKCCCIDVFKGKCVNRYFM